MALGRQQIATKAGIYLSQRNLLECRNMDKFSHPSTPAAAFRNCQKFSACQKCQNENIHEIAFTYAFTFPLMLTLTFTFPCIESTKRFPTWEYPTEHSVFLFENTIKRIYTLFPSRISPSSRSVFKLFLQFYFHFLFEFLRSMCGSLERLIFLAISSGGSQNG